MYEFKEYPKMVGDKIVNSGEEEDALKPKKKRTYKKRTVKKKVG